MTREALKKARAVLAAPYEWTQAKREQIDEAIADIDAALALTDAPADEREAFEVWAEANQFNTHRDDTDKYRDYHRATTRWAWTAWQARAASAPAAPLTERESQKLVDYPAAIAYCYAKLKHAQGTSGCIAFCRGAEWQAAQRRSDRADQDH